MQKEAILLESIVIPVLLVGVIWERYRQTIKRWWKAWRARPKRRWTLRDREPSDCPDPTLPRRYVVARLDTV